MKQSKVIFINFVAETLGYKTQKILSENMFSIYKNNPAKFEKQLIKEISEALNIDESRIKFIDAREGGPKL